MSSVNISYPYRALFQTNAPSQYTTSFGAAAPAAQPNYETISLVCTAHMNHLFGSARYPYPCPRSAWQSHLPSYIKAALISSQLDVSIVYHAMTLLGQYKFAVPHSVAYYDDAYRLFMSAYIVAAKVSCDTPHAPRFWRLVGRGKFTSEELLKMELEFCHVLEWDVQIPETAFAWFKGIVESYDGTSLGLRCSMIRPHATSTPGGM
ncbi:hypothetical protein NLJ89_g10696 [Agrocybe chaxingu]|uniref:Cyclin N-terminal domain-containing protein n=1 Tax=Agrocybe chaxingu TaxID=84603 RepID=A0A9W8JQM9_9AGAR|nr:hypothetical protein NLJ89_g10696 [Agrocybe chaxingu]